MDNCSWLGQSKICCIAIYCGHLFWKDVYYSSSIVDALNDAFERLTSNKTEDIENQLKNAERALVVWKQGFEKIKEAA